MQPCSTLSPKVTTTVEFEVPRCLGRYDSGCPGPLMLVTAGMHGNEPAGVRAARRVIEILQAQAIPLAGRVVALSGNRAALRAGERFLCRDLNRVWSEAELTRLSKRSPEEDDVEGREQRELLAAIRREIEDWPGEPILLDLHTTSGGGAPFALSADTLQNRSLARALPIPLVMGLEEGINGPLLSYLADRGSPALVVEGGQHTSPNAQGRLEAALWLFLVGSGALSAEHPCAQAGRVLLRKAAGEVPPLLEIVHVHRIGEGDDFHMLPGFANFDPIEVGRLLAYDRHGPIRSPQSGLILMPLYQPQGQDGFFLCRGISPGWLAFSEALRRSGCEALLPSLPGVAAVPHRKRCLRVEEEAPPIVWKVLRHFGYRKRVGEGLLQRRAERGECPGAGFVPCD